MQRASDTDPTAKSVAARQIHSYKKLLIVPYFLIIPGVAALAASLPLLLSTSIFMDALFIFLFPAVFAVSYVATAGLLSLPHQGNITPGTFLRSLDDPTYIDRRLYGLCLTSVYYFTPIYSFILYIPIFRKSFFFLFGYRGNLDFTIHPDTWIRDLPLVRFGKGAYIANQATIGTNIISKDNYIRVDRVEVGDNSIVGSHTLIAPGTVIGSNVEIGIRTILGLKVRIRDGANIGPDCAFGHDVIVGERATIGRRCEIDTRSRIPPDLSP